MKKTWIIVLIVICVLLLAIGGVVAAAYGMLGKTHSTDTPIVEKPDIVTLPEEDDTLELIEGTPDDIDEDYDVELPDDMELQQTPIYEQVAIDENVINILLIGQDTGLERNKSTRSDTCMIVSYNRTEKSVKMVSVMRDTWTRIEGHGWNRINAAYSFGGVGLLINTLNDTYDLDIQNYVITGFDEFEDCIDQLGGLDMELTKKEANFINNALGTDLEEGMNHLDGAMALKHARNRKTGDGDFGRIKRQRDIILNAFNKLKKVNDVPTYLSFIEFALGNIKTNMEPAEIITLGIEVLQAEKLDIAYARVPYDGTWSYAMKDGKSVLSVDFDENKELLKAFLYGEE